MDRSPLLPESQGQVFIAGGKAAPRTMLQELPRATFRLPQPDSLPVPEAPAGQLYPAPAQSSFAHDLSPAPAPAAAPAPDGGRRNLEVDVVSGARVAVLIVVDGKHVGSKQLFKTQIYRDSKVLSLMHTLRHELEIDQCAAELAKSEVRQLDCQVTQDGAIVRGKESCALFFSDKSQNTTDIEITFSFARVLREQPCCCCCVA